MLSSRCSKILQTYDQPSRRRGHWSYITPRRWRQYFLAPSRPIFTVFLLGLLARSLVLTVTPTTHFRMNEMLKTHSNPGTGACASTQHG
ncbi:hypothetical protein CPB83DRAFT_900964 [Crepidotus variabilis]|uniref:Uncharacterized protein n=1 Tax=Crepidotus variabilis TaxID=179855 RepID=A0A9P6BBJ1_9AGAR|nr:hypothetical protein CPB83DRAFT_900964 [Crepidotus variabilis]